MVAATVPSSPNRSPPPPTAVASAALADVARYARATSASVDVRRRDREAVVEIADDGVGGADPARGTGLRGLADRVAALDGTFSVSGAATGGTVVRATMPLAR